MNRISSFLLFVLVSCTVFGQVAKNYQDEQETENLLSKYIQSKGTDAVSFDTSNIKQFWIDNSVVSRKNAFEITLTPQANVNESVPLKIQLINVNESQDCKVEVIAATKDFELFVLNSKNVEVPSSSSVDSFIDYSVVSSVFHLEDTQNTSFNLVFSSKSEKTLSIKRIILTFSKNQTGSFLAPPGKITLSEETVTSNTKSSKLDDNSFSVTGKRTVLFSSKKILVANNTLSTTVKIKNTGDNPTHIFVGYSIYSKDRLELRGNNYPYSDKVLNVISAEKGSKRIIVDSYADWANRCFLALNAKEDLSDIPNNTFVPGRIACINKFENGQAEILLDNPLDSNLNKGTKLRVHGDNGSYLYTHAKRLEPGEEQVFTSTIKKDESSCVYSSKAFPKGVYYVVPLILSYSADSTKENTIRIDDYTISY